jgi:hypothetical protein
MKTFAFLATAMLAVGCADNMEPSDDVADDSVASKDDSAAAKPAGHYVLEGNPTPMELTDLVLNADHTFTRNIFVYCAAESITLNCGHEAGSYKFTKSTTSSTRYIRFIDDQGNLMDRYTYVVQADSSLKLRRADDDSAKTFAMAPHQFQNW